MSQRTSDQNLATQVLQAGREQYPELDHLEGASSDNRSEVLEWCKRAIDYLGRDVAKKGNDWNAESGPALRLTIAAYRQAVAQGADSALLTQLQIEPLRTIVGRPVFSPMTAGAGLIKLQSLAEWCIRAAEDAKTGAPRKPKGKRGRKLDTNPNDKRVVDAWSTGRYRTYEECGQALRMTGRQVQLAIDRHRHRKPDKRLRGA
jgi:hypothetical protein